MPEKVFVDYKKEEARDGEEIKKCKSKGWNPDEKIESQLASEGKLCALNRIHRGSLSPLSSKSVREMSPKELEMVLQKMVEIGEINQKRKDKILSTIRKFFEGRDLTHGK